MISERGGVPLSFRQSKGREPVHEFTEIDGQRVVRYAQARVMKQTCVECHNKHPQSPRTDWQVGDVRGVLVIIRPLGNDETRVSEALRLAVLLSAIVSGLLVGGSMLVMWADRKPHPCRVVKENGAARRRNLQGRKAAFRWKFRRRHRRRIHNRNSLCLDW